MLDEVDLAAGLPIETRVNGEVMQSSNTSELVFDVPTLIAWISQGLTLEPGDVILTGTPAGVGAARTPPRWLRRRRRRRDHDRRARHPAQSGRPPVAHRACPTPDAGRVG